jgi:4-coumarate--CoA ligase
LLPNLEARLVIDDEMEAGEGEPGEIWVRGPTIMKVLQLVFRV